MSREDASAQHCVIVYVFIFRLTRLDRHVQIDVVMQTYLDRHIYETSLRYVYLDRRI